MWGFDSFFLLLLNIGKEPTQKRKKGKRKKKEKGENE